MKNLNETKQGLREILIQSIPELIKSLKVLLPPNGARYQDLILIEGRLRDINLSALRGVISNEDLQLAYNQMRADLLELINSIAEADLDSSNSDTAYTNAKVRTGSILYRIPDAMQLDREHKCTVRIAIREEMLIEDIELDKEVQIQQIRISDVMMVQLLEPSQVPHFQIRAVNSAEQFLDEDTFTEWLFYVKPLVAGSFALLLKVSVVEQVNGKERCREIVLEETVEVLAEKVEEVVPNPLKSSAIRFSLSGYPADESHIYPESQPSALPSLAKSKNPFAVNLRTLALIGTIILTGFFIYQVGFQRQKSEDTFFSIGDNEKLFYDSSNATTEIADSARDSIMDTQGISSDIFKNKQNNTTGEVTEIEMVLIRGGTFMMGCDAEKDGPCESNTLPQRKIRIESFYLGVTEVTTTQYATFLNEYLSETVKEGPDQGKALLQDAPWLLKSSNGRWSVLQGMENLPAFLVTWYGAQEYARYYGMRLPSEAEWEFAARGGRTQSGFRYAGSDDPDEVAWFRGNADNRVHAVRMKAANALGVYDLSGNVWEWTADCGHSNYAGAPTNGKAWITAGDCGIRMLRGGSFTFPQESAKNCSRLAGKAMDGQHHIGFRVARDH